MPATAEAAGGPRHPELPDLRRRSGGTSGTGSASRELQQGEALAVMCSLTTLTPDGESVSALLRVAPGAQPAARPAVAAHGQHRRDRRRAEHVQPVDGVGLRRRGDGRAGDQDRVARLREQDRLGRPARPARHLADNVVRADRGDARDVRHRLRRPVRVPEGAAAAGRDDPALRDEADGPLLQPGRPVPGRGAGHHADHRAPPTTRSCPRSRSWPPRTRAGASDQLERHRRRRAASIVDSQVYDTSRGEEYTLTPGEIGLGAGSPSTTCCPSTTSTRPSPTSWR